MFLLLNAGHASCGSRAEANILKHVKKDWPDLPDVLSISSGNSNNSSPTHFNSPERNSSNFQTTRDGISHCKTPEEKQMISVYDDGTFASLTSKAMPGTKSLLSTQKLMDSILGFEPTLSSSKCNNALFEPTA
jgi:hypothetical protein